MARVHGKPGVCAVLSVRVHFRSFRHPQHLGSHRCAQYHVGLQFRLPEADLSLVEPQVWTVSDVNDRNDCSAKYARGFSTGYFMISC